MGKEDKENSCVLRSEVDSMERIVKLFFSWHQGLNDAGGKDMTRDPVPAFSKCIQKLSTVAKLWDDYLTEVSFEAKLSPVKFADLIERVPAYARVTHDNVYKAIHSYLKVNLKPYSKMPYGHYFSTAHSFLFFSPHYKNLDCTDMSTVFVMLILLTPSSVKYLMLLFSILSAL